MHWFEKKKIVKSMVLQDNMFRNNQKYLYKHHDKSTSWIKKLWIIKRCSFLKSFFDQKLTQTLNLVSLISKDLSFEQPFPNNGLT